MAVIKTTDVTIASPDGLYVASVLANANSPLSILLEYQGAALTVTTMTLSVKYGGNTVNPTVTIASGQCTATLTTAHLATLGTPAILSTMTAFWEGTYSVGAVTHNLRHEMPLIVSDRVFRWSVLYSKLVKRIPQLSNTAALPVNQATFWDQCVEALEDLAVDIENLSGTAKLNLLANNGGMLNKLAKYACIEMIYRRMAGQDNNQSYLRNEADRYKQMIEDYMEAAKVVTKTDTSEFGTEGAGRATTNIKSNVTQPGFGVSSFYGGGVW
jgi:hypothetical protein